MFDSVRYDIAKIEALGRSEDRAATLGVLQYYHAIGAGDPVSKHTARMALRNLLSLKKSFAPLLVDELPADISSEVASVAVAVPTPEAADWLLQWLSHSGNSASTDAALRSRAFAHIARNLPENRTADLVAMVQKHFSEDLDTQLDLFTAIREGRSSSSPTFRSRDSSPSPAGLASAPDSTSESRATGPLATWSTELTQRLLTALKSEPANTWHPVTPPTDTNPNPWRPTTRKGADGRERAFLDSHVAPGSEKFTGTLRSTPFALPAKLTFWIAGHRGFPTAEPHDKNYVRLVDAETGEELARAYPPRHDAAQQITWNFDQAEDGTRAHQHTVLELTDGDDATAYAWLAAGGFDPAVVTIPNDALQRDKRIRMLAQLCTTSGSAAPPADTEFLSSLPNKAGLTPDTRAALADFLAARSSDSSALLLAPLARDAELAPVVFAALQDPQTTSDELAKAFRTEPFRAQAKLATALAGSVSGANQLLKLAPPAVLAEPLVSSKLNALDDAKIAQRLKALTASLPPHNEALNKLIAQRLRAYNAAKADATRGEQVFTTVCFICHRIGVRGNLVGPQLDGIGARGIERLLEDILDPNRSVDPAFRLHLVKRKDGTLYAGLQRREEGDALVFADATAQETRIPKSDIAGNEESAFSLMPPGLGDVLTEQQLDDLLAYLLARK
jgi:putative heme-binding domain-containing protein